MSAASNYITSIPVFQGVQGKFYIVNGVKYHTCFPIEWAMNHLAFTIGQHELCSGPAACQSCSTYGSIRGVFVGYCANCLREYKYRNLHRGNLTATMACCFLDDVSLWDVYPYMYGVNTLTIGDQQITYEYDQIMDHIVYEGAPQIHDEGYDQTMEDIVYKGAPQQIHDDFLYDAYDTHYDETMEDIVYKGWGQMDNETLPQISDDFVYDAPSQMEDIGYRGTGLIHNETIPQIHDESSQQMEDIVYDAYDTHYDETPSQMEDIGYKGY